MNNQQAAEAAIIIANNRLEKKRLQPLPDIKRPQDLNEAYKIQKNNNVNILSTQSKGYHGRDLYFIHPNQVCGALIEVEAMKKE